MTEAPSPDWLSNTYQRYHAVDQRDVLVLQTLHVAHDVGLRVVAGSRGQRSQHEKLRAAVALTGLERTFQAAELQVAELQSRADPWCWSSGSLSRMEDEHSS